MTFIKSIKILLAQGSKVQVEAKVKDILAS